MATVSIVMVEVILHTVALSGSNWVFSSWMEMNMDINKKVAWAMIAMPVCFFVHAGLGKFLYRYEELPGS